MSDEPSRVKIHMAASLDGFVAREDGRVDWMETHDRFEGGETLGEEQIASFLETIDCYVMGSRTYETAHRFDAEGKGWAYGDKPVYVLTTRDLPKARDTVSFLRGDQESILRDQLRPRHPSIWVVGGGEVSGECLRRGLADEVVYSILPVAIGRGIPFFRGLDVDVPLHLAEVKTYDSGTVEMRYEVRR